MILVDEKNKMDAQKIIIMENTEIERYEHTQCLLGSANHIR